MKSTASLLLALSFGPLGCGDDGPNGLDRPPSLPTAGDTYVIDSLTLGQNPADFFAEHSVDVDGDGTSENSIGSSLRLFYRSETVDAEAVLGAGIASGEIMHLIALGADDVEYLDTARLFLGADTDGDVANNFSGEASLAIRPRTSREHAAFGSREGAAFSYERGTMLLETNLFGVIALPLTNVVVEGTVAADGSLVGRLGGATSTEEAEARLRPAISSTLAAAIARDCQGSEPGACCTAGSEGEHWLSWVNIGDETPACSYTEAEIASSWGVRIALAPDLDLDRDGIDDALSVGFGFTAVPARYPLGL